MRPEDVYELMGPDGSGIAFAVSPSPLEGPRHGQIGVLDRKAGAIRRLTDGLDRNATPYPPGREPIWSGDDVYFRIEDSGNTALYRVAGDGSGKPELVIGGDRQVVDFEDLMAVVDEAVSLFDFIDTQRLGVLGGSYGGYMTSWIVGHTSRFKAACSERAVNNLLTASFTSDYGPFLQHFFGVTHLEDPEEYLRMSPITHAANITTPLLILHSEEDLRCAVEQAEQLYVVLKLMRRKVEFYRFPGESHELSRSGSPRHRVQRFEIILDFFNRHLRPKKGREA